MFLNLHVFQETKWILVQLVTRCQVSHEDDVIHILKGLIHISRLRTGHRLQSLVIFKLYYG
ncbi:hypothetical protein Hanom_Chr05g00403791 [Helianthus anomalus]